MNEPNKDDQQNQIESLESSAARWKGCAVFLVLALLVVLSCQLLVLINYLITGGKGGAGIKWG